MKVPGVEFLAVGARILNYFPEVDDVISSALPPNDQLFTCSLFLAERTR